MNKTSYAGVKRAWGSLKIAAFLAYKSMRRGNKWALILIIMVMSFSFVNLVFVSSLISGVTTTMDDQMVDTLFANVVIGPEENEYYLSKVAQLEDRIEQIPGVVGASAHLNYSAFVEYQWKEKESQSDRGKSGSWKVIGVAPEKEANVTTIRENIIEGSYLAGNDRGEIVLGVEIAGGEDAQTSSFLNLGGVRTGDKVRLTYPNGVQREYKVKGIFRARELEADNLAFVTRKEMASVLGRDVFYDRASEILVKARRNVDESALIAELKAMGINGEVRSWQEYGGAMHSVMSTFEVIGSLIGGVGLVVATAVMFIVIYIEVLSKKRQIGVLRAIGIRQSAIIGSYLIQAFFYVIAGIISGWLIVRFVLQPYFMLNPLDLPIGLVSLTVEALTLGGSTLGLVIAGILAGLIPAWTIMRESIINLIWGT
ncbi:MAG: FtsX-like permease family protein [Chloroflexota bacterium]|nr:FtsX-like permease family protein [Chloroflexota bacterium]